ncbi:hypothetical protein BV20DRAFT_273694 [Pilatotrama ljubarskyi]|nr:hypothetical protein BV20DRAFT_273694 [Pilatotrama ljubarskyi]
MPCFAHKRLPSPSPDATRGPPLKRMKMAHPSEHSLSDVPSGDPRRNPAVALLSSADRTHHSVRPLTKCHAANEFAQLREHDTPVSTPSRSYNTTPLALLGASIVACVVPSSCSAQPQCAQRRSLCSQRSIVRDYNVHSQNLGLICPDTHQTPERMPQTLLSWSASHQLLHKQPQRASISAVVSAPPWAHATPEDGYYISSGDALASSSPASPLPPLPSSVAAPPMAYTFAPEAGPPTSCRSHFSFVDKELYQNQSPSAAGVPSYEPDVLDYLYEGLEPSAYGFTEDAFSRCAFTAGEQLSEPQGWEPDMASPNPQSPIFRSMSRSSFGSSSYMDYSSPGDYGTPASDSSVTTPAPSEAAFGWFPELRHPLFGEELPCGVEAKTKDDPQCSYVQDFPGSAPLSPNAFLSYSFDACQPEAIAVPSNEGSSLAGARRHSEPANLAALQLPPFFQEQLSQIAPPSTDAATLPITDNNLASSSSAATPSSIAPHQTQLSRPLEIMQPRPVRAYKPPILRDDRHYDPKDFVRRHSEPILPLRELDVCSHLPLDITEESAEEADDAMMFEEADEESYDGEGSSDEEASMDDYALDGLDMHASSDVSQGELLFDPQWSWMRPTAEPSAPLQAWPSAEIFGTDVDWTAAFAIPPAPSGFSSDTRPDGLQL